MKFTKEDLSLENGLNKEWIITNGIGGFSSSTIIGANTRRYHGLLIAPLNPPAKRYLILSKLDESVEIEEKEIPLYTNVCQNYISDGFKHQISFEKDYVPTFEYQINGINIKKTVCLEYGKNTVFVYYKIKNSDKPVKLKLTPIINYRDFHGMSTNEVFHIQQDIKGKKVNAKIDNNDVYFYCSEGEYIEHKNDIFKNMNYIEEEKRGFYPLENHGVIGRYEIEIKPNEEKDITFLCSLEEIKRAKKGKTVIEKEKKRIDDIIKKTNLIENKKNKTDEEIKNENLIKTFIIATDIFIIKRPKWNTYSIIAGYPWFLDWGRDTLISFEGLLLITKRFDIAKKVLLSMKHDIKQGLVPNGYDENTDKPLYNSVDASLLLFEQINKYLEYTKDYVFVKKEFYKVLVDILENYSNGIDLSDNNIYLDSDGLIVSGTENTQNTWMDAKYNGIAATPRNGKAVEINALWYNALKTVEKLAIRFKEKEDEEKYSKLAEKSKRNFKKKFYNEKKKCLYDVVGDSKIRPNQLFAISLTYPVIDCNSKIAKEIYSTTTKKLKNKYGLKTLAKGEENYIEVYEGNSFKRDMSYHQGITWPWLMGIYADGLKNIKNSVKTIKDKKVYKEEYENLVKEIKETYEKAIIEDKCVGNISELYDSKKPYLPKGTFAQAWSVAEIFKIILHNKTE